MEHGLVAAIHPPGSGQELPGAGGDRLLARLVTAGACPITLVEDTSADREWVPLHSHPWDELTYVLEGADGLHRRHRDRRGRARHSGQPPRGVPHTLRVPTGTARFLLLTIGAPSLDFLREVGEVYATGPTLERLVEVAGRHGVKPAFELPGS